MNATSPSQAAELANVPAYDDMMQTVLDALRAQGGQATNAEIATYVAQTLELPPDVVALIHQPGRNLTRLEYNLMWTRTYLRQFGLIGKFSKGIEEAACERGAAPITLIDGEKLLDLLLEYEIGVNKRQMEYFEFAPEKLVQFEAERNGQSAP